MCDFKTFRKSPVVCDEIITTCPKCGAEIILVRCENHEKARGICPKCGTEIILHPQDIQS